MFSKHPILLIPLAVSVAVPIFLFDMMLPLGVAAGVPYVALVLFGSWFPERRHVYALAVASSVLIVAGYAVSPPGMIFWIAFVNRGLALFAVWITAILISRRKQAERDVHDAKEQAEHAREAAEEARMEAETANLALMEKLFKRLPSVRMISAHTAELGLELAEQQRPDVVLMDINLPGMNGIEALEQIRASAQLRDIPVIAVSANAMPRDIEAALKAGFQDYITKPFQVDQTLKTVKKNLVQRCAKTYPASPSAKCRTPRRSGRGTFSRRCAPAGRGLPACTGRRFPPPGGSFLRHPRP